MFTDEILLLAQKLVGHTKVAIAPDTLMALLGGGGAAMARNFSYPKRLQAERQKAEVAKGTINQFKNLITGVSSGSETIPAGVDKETALNKIIEMHQKPVRAASKQVAKTDWMEKNPRRAKLTHVGKPLAVAGVGLGVLRMIKYVKDKVEEERMRKLMEESIRYGFSPAELAFYYGKSDQLG